MNKYFIIAPYRQAVLYRALRDEMNENGFEMTHDWLEATNGIKLENGTQIQQELLKKDLQGIVQANLVILLPGGNDSFIEYGAALMSGALICVATPELDSVEASHFNHDSVHRMEYDATFGVDRTCAKEIVEYIKEYMV